MKKTLLILAFFLPLTALAAYVVPQGGTGQSTLPASQLLTGNGANAIYGTATTTASCSGSASCSPFTVLGSMPITISATAGTTYTGTYPISVTGSVISTVATSSLGLTTASFASPNISQWTNNSGYLTANQSITLSGDITGSGATSIATTLATVNSNVGTFTYPSITVNGKGLITAASSLTPVTSIKQTFGTAQTGAITLATTSASFNGLTVADAITNSSGTFTIAPQWSGTLNNSGLTNPSLTVNTASPLGGGGSVSLGGTLNLTCSTCLTSAGAVTSIAQTYGTAQTGAITFATSTDSFNGLSANELITNTGGAFTFANNITGLLSVAGGGTGVGTQTTNGVNFYNGTNITSGTGLTFTGSNLGVASTSPDQVLGVNGFVDTPVGYDINDLLILNNDATDLMVGPFALDAVTTGTDDVAVGYNALTGATTATEETAVGVDALESDSVAGTGRNAAFGFEALNGNSTGIENAAFGGYRTMYENTTGTQNVGVGFEADYGNETGSGNSALGFEADQGTAGDTLTGDTGLGWEAGVAFTTANYNTLVGYGSGAVITSGDENTLIGADSAGDNTITTGTQDILIGYNISPQSVSTAGNINIGNVIYATGATGTGLSSAGAVGIGTSTPWTTGFGSVGTVAMSGLGAATAGNDVLCINPTTFKVLPGGSGTSCAVSNEKYKQDIASSTVGIAELMQLDPVVYYFDNASTSGGEPAQQIGLLANQAYTVDPRLTQQDASGTPNALRLDDIEGLLIKSVQDIWNHDTVQDQQIATLQEQVAALQTEMSACTKP